jgi:hypothetical protein
MPRFFVNSMSNFMFQGSIVSFTLQDQAMKTQDGQPRQAEPEDIVDVVMREQDFAQLVQFFNQHLAAYQKQPGKQSGASTKPGAPPAPAVAKPAAPLAKAGGGFKIRPKGT